MTYSAPDELLARPDQTLQDHLDGVLENTKRLVPDEATTHRGYPIQRVAEIIAQLHDIGKLTQWFQSYIHPGDRLTEPARQKRHSLVSAYLTLHALHHVDAPKDVRLAGFYAVTKHHGVLPNFKDAHGEYSMSVSSRRQNQIELVADQIRNIDSNVSAVADRILRDATDGQFSWSDVYVDHAEGYTEALPNDFAPDDQEHFYSLVMRLWSTLTCSDKLDAANVSIDDSSPKNPDPGSISFENDAEGILRDLNSLRTQAREDTTDRLGEISSEQSVYTLTLPTGFGKTFAGLQAGLSLAESKQGRLIYALPYTTVLDQVNDDIIETFGVSPDRERYTIHHHLADTRTRVGSDEDRVSDGSETLYGESWQSGLVLTTFVQLFESLAGPANTQSIKLPALQDSVIVVDEPQAITKEWWYLISRLADILVEEYDATIILMTATQPGLLAETNPRLDPTELVSDPDTYFQFLQEHERVRFEIDDSAHPSRSNQLLDYDDAASRLYRATFSGGVSSVLAVSNTVQAASELHRQVEQLVRDDGRTSVSLGDELEAFRSETATDLRLAVQEGDAALQKAVHSFLEWVADETGGDDLVLQVGLSTALRPLERTILIETIQRIVDAGTETPVDEYSLIVSSTQLVEAGVDVSFDRLFRDYAPIPSLVQAAGRCNRSFEGGTSTVTLWKLAGEEDSPPPSAIYTFDGDLLRPTRTALSELAGPDITEIAEYDMVTSGVRTYYEQLHGDENLSTETDDLARAVVESKGETLRNASLIADEGEDAVIITTEADARLVKRYIESRDRRDFDDAAAAFDSLKYLTGSAGSDFQDDTASFVSSETAVDLDSLDLVELSICDSRGNDRYTIGDGAGVRET